MVDRKARDNAAAVLRQLVEGAVTNVEYERKYPTNKDDPALWAVYIQSWFSYSDRREHTLTGRYTPNDEGRRLFERCILFLRTDWEFEWPAPKIGLRGALIRLLGLGWLLKQRDRKEMSVGDVEVWPFLRRCDYESALGQQRQPNKA
jgi:hypothetical protein